MPLVATPSEGLILLPFPCEARLRSYTTGQSSLEMKAEHKISHLSAGGCCEGFLPKQISKVSGLIALQGAYLFGNASRQQGNLASSGSTAPLSRYFGSKHHGSHNSDYQEQL